MAEDRVAENGKLINAVFGGGRDVAADSVSGAGYGFGGEPSGNLLLGLGRADVSFGLVRGGRHLQVVGEADDVVEAVAENLQQATPGRLFAFRVRVALHLGQSDGDAGT